MEHPRLTPLEDQLLDVNSTGAHAGHYFTPEEAANLVSDILPSLSRKMTVEILTDRLPRTLEEAPRLILRAEANSPTELSVVAQLAYGNPPVAIVNDMRLTSMQSQVVVIRDTNEERALLQKLNRELQLQIGRPVLFQGTAAIEFIRRSKDWDVEGNGRQAFTPRAPLAARLESNGTRFEVHFEGQLAG